MFPRPMSAINAEMKARAQEDFTALLPNHKLLFGQPFDAVMPKYLKLRQTWRV